MKHVFILSRKITVLFVLLLVASLTKAQTGFLRNSSSTSLTSGVTIAEVCGVGNPGFDFDCNGAVNSGNDEFVELFNTSNDTIDISGWMIGDNTNRFFFPTGTILCAGKRVVLFQNGSLSNGGTLVAGSGPSTFNVGDSNYSFNWNTGMSNTSEAVGLRNKVNIYIGVSFINGTLNSNVTSGATLAGTIVNNATVSTGASWERSPVNGAWRISTPLSQTFNWSSASVTFTNPRGTPGRDTTGRQSVLPAPASAPGMTFGTATANTLPIASLTNTLQNSRRIIVARTGGLVSFTPTDTVAYSGVNANFTTATDQGSGNKIVFDGFTTSNPVTVSGLNSSTKYYFKVYEYNGRTPASDIRYRTSSTAVDSATTIAPSTPTVSLSANANNGTEAGTTVITLTATASSAVSGDQTVDLNVSGTGITAGDYSLGGSQITILNGNTTGTQTFTIVNDTLGESTETAAISISNPSSGLTLTNPTQVSVSITDNEPTVTISASTNSTSEGGSTVTVYAVLSSQVPTPQTVNIGISGSGVTAADYSLSGTTISIPANSDSGMVTLTIVNDNIREVTETYTASLSAPSPRISLGTSTTNISVADNDDLISIPSLNVALPADTFDNVIAVPGSQMITGWYFKEDSSNANNFYDTSSGASTTGNTFSFGANGSNERAFGSLTSGSLRPVYFGAKYTNNTGSSINSLLISYIGEMWLYQGNTDKLDFQYSLNANDVKDVSATWIDANNLDFTSPSGTGNGRLNGNSAANRAYLTNQLISLSSSVSNGGSFWIRFFDDDVAGGDAGLAVDSFVLTAKNITATHFYSKSSGDLSLTSNWGDQTNGSGTQPNNFTDDAQVFHVVNNNNHTIANDWTVSGIASKVMIGDGSNNVTFTAPSNKVFSAIVDVRDLSTLKLLSATYPTFGSLDTNSTVEYAQTSAATISNVPNYGNLKISGTGTKTFTSGTTNVNKDYILQSATIDFPTSATSMNLVGNITITGSITHVDTARAIGIVTVGNGNQTFSGTGAGFTIFRLTSIKSAGSLALSNLKLKTVEDYRLTYTGSATFNDGGNTLYCGDDFQATGSSSQYNLTGTLVMRTTPSSASGNNIEASTSGGTIVAQLNNVTWDVTGANSGSFGGSNPVYINGDFTVTSNNTVNIALGSNTYNIKGNWVNNRSTDVVTEGTSKVNMLGTSAQSITAANSSGETFYDLIINNSNGVSTTSKITTSDSLKFTSGILATSNIVIIPSGAIVSRVSGHVNGQMRKNYAIAGSVTNTYEIGDASNYLPVTFVANNVTANGNITIGGNQTNIAGALYSTVCIDTNKTIDRIWTIAKTGGVAFSTYDATFTFAGNDTASGGAASSNVQAFAYDGVNIEKANMNGTTTSTFSFNGDTLTGIIYAGELRNITSTFNKSTASPCIGNNTVFTYTGNADASFTYAWNFSGANIVSGSGNNPYTVNWSATGQKNISLMVSGLGCTASTTNDSIIVYQNGWTGAVDTLWTRAANWCSGTVPTSTSDVVIPTGLTNYPTVHATATCQNLTIANGASLKIVAGGRLTVTGTYIKNGTLNHLSGYLVLTNTNNIPADNYFALRLNGATATYTLLGNTTVNNVFELTNSGASIVNGGFNLTLNNDAIVNGTISGSGKTIFSRASGYQTLSGAATYGNVEINTSATGGLRVAANNTINNVLTLTSGTLLLNPSVVVTVGSPSLSTSNIITTGGIILAGSSANTSELIINGNSSAPQISNFKFTTPGNLTINRPNGIKLGANMTVGGVTTLTNGLVQMNGYNFVSGNTGTSAGSITGSGSINNNISAGTLSILGNASASLLSNLKIDSLFNLTINRPNGISLGGNCFINGIAYLQKGDVGLNTYTVTLGTTASVSEVAGNTFTGTVGKITTTRNFASAISSLNIAGMGLKLTTTAAPGSTTIDRGHSIYGSMTGTSISRYFDMTPTNNVTASYFEFNYDSTELNGSNRSKLRINRSVNGGTNWTNIVACSPTTANNATGYVSKTGGISLTGTIKFTASDSVSSPLSPVFTSAVDPIVPSSNVSNNKQLVAVYPNPFLNELTIDLNANEGTYNLQLSDLNGKVVISKVITVSDPNARLLLPTDGLASGVYMLSTNSNSGSQTIKLIKQ